ncbi:unnamed protein product [Moneuplotes crassus]|uniref:UBC core domain-containing protein n=1 Tax=Euplotes crassus TaxID=5936 RepID=A0AAD1XYC0_EUPCR|nr:unnamed protein product [Moneuplotes crassus]|mmetsp:Transcript_22543/g.22368  ORF Transcript_22543/g.22368 Transcript_22543/m.22368 type:complete len:152 (-) Transcript_22543:45-500(-)
MSKIKGHKRLVKEIKDLQENYEEFKIHFPDPDTLYLFNAVFDGAEGSLYEGETLELQFKFDDTFPFEAPEVIFVGDIPTHPHVYSNGYICLSILYDHWTPALRVSSIILSILSMLSSCEEKVGPENDGSFSRYAKGKSPKSFNWVFEDDKC